MSDPAAPSPVEPRSGDICVHRPGPCCQPEAHCVHRRVDGLGHPYTPAAPVDDRPGLTEDEYADEMARLTGKDRARFLPDPTPAESVGSEVRSV